MAAVGDDDCSLYLGGVKRTGGVKRGVGDGERLRREQGGAVPFPENVAMAMVMMMGWMVMEMLYWCGIEDGDWISYEPFDCRHREDLN